MIGEVAALEGLHVTGKFRDKNMTHTSSRHAAWDPHTHPTSQASVELVPPEKRPGTLSPSDAPPDLASRRRRFLRTVHRQLGGEL